jgi:chorismate mutase
MDWQTVINFVLGSFTALIGWFAREIWDAIKELRGEIKQLDRQMHQDFVRRDDFRDAMAEHKQDMQQGFREVKELLGAVFKRLESKQDK